MKEIPVTEDLLHKLFKFYDAMKVAREIENYEPDVAAHRFFAILEEVYEDDREKRKKKT